ncbi:unnamed protein product [Bursaphelenchus okinawaensis]|uniref:Cys_knot domain-containing protein n=1 Tax=Bursaphelenchus okinawaensis TaxID=465554 RepID=A0A811L517_9BILA|nr:unnamed protein product [Bursaphelenchus okinawaensis]CAG9117596.1 unnamed protein product [Bursaphelenchus okinawaensis]
MGKSAAVRMINRPLISNTFHPILIRFRLSRGKRAATIMNNLIVSIVILVFVKFSSSEQDCQFSMRRIPEYSSVIRTDNAGRSCRGNIDLPYCKGACLTSDEGVHVFPYRQANSSVCALIGTDEKNVTLHDCDKDADESVRYVTISASTSCGCQKLTDGGHN